MEKTITFQCEDCDEGFQEYGPVCNKPASMCCGGCFEKVKCEECDGSGEKEVEIWEVDFEELLTEAMMEAGFKREDFDFKEGDEFPTLRYRYWKQMSDEELKKVHDELPDGVKLVMDTYVDDDGETDDGRTIFRYLYSYNVKID